MLIKIESELGYGFLLLFRTTQELEYLFLLSRKAQFFFPEFNIRLYDKNSESDFFHLSADFILSFYL
jgi:hypothetical protein